MTDPARIADPAVRALAREVVALRRELDVVKEGQRSTQLGNSSVEDGVIRFNDSAGIQRVAIGRQTDGKFGWGAVNGDPPPRPNTPELVSTVNGVAISWDGTFNDVTPSDFTHVKAYLSPVGAGFIPNEGNIVGHFIGAARLPVAPLDPGTNYWCKLIAYNTSGVAGEVSFTAGPVMPTAVVATEILDGIVTETKLAAGAVTAAKLAAGAVGTAALAGGAVNLSKLADGSVDAAKLINGAVTAGKIADNAVGSDQLITGSIIAGKIAAGAIGANELAANSVVAGKIAADSVTTSTIVAGAVQALQIAAEAISAGKIAAGAVTTEKLSALAVVADKIAANAIQAGHIEAGAITADKLEAIMVLANTVIAGDPNDWHLELGDANTPILYWNGDQTGFAVSRDQTNGQSNVYMSGRVQFGNGSQIEQDYLDLCEQPATGYQTPKPRQQRSWVDSGPKNAITPRWPSATQPGNLLVMSVYVVASAGGSGAPAVTVPAGWNYVDGVTVGTGKLLLYQISNSTGSRAAEPFTASLNSRWAVGLFEYDGIVAATALDKFANNSGTGTVANSGTTTATAQANELQFAAWASPTIGQSGTWKSSTNGFSIIQSGNGAVGHGYAVGTKVATGTGTVSSSVTMSSSNAWLGVVATFRTATADPTPPKPPAKVTRLYTRSRAGASIPHMIDSTGASFPLGRTPYCRVRLNASSGSISIGVAADLFAQGDWQIATDPYGMAAVPATSGSLANITIPVSGNYLVDYRTVWQESTNTANFIVGFITLNGTAAGTDAVARDARRWVPGGNDGSHTDAMRVLPLVAGDILYWGNYHNTPGTAPLIYNRRVNQPTEMSVTYIGAT